MIGETIWPWPCGWPLGDTHRGYHTCGTTLFMLNGSSGIHAGLHPMSEARGSWIQMHTDQPWEQQQQHWDLTSKEAKRKIPSIWTMQATFSVGLSISHSLFKKCPSWVCLAGSLLIDSRSRQTINQDLPL